MSSLLQALDPIEFVDLFVTTDGNMATVSVEETVVETIRVPNEVVSIIDSELGS